MGSGSGSLGGVGLLHGPETEISLLSIKASDTSIVRRNILFSSDWTFVFGLVILKDSSLSKGNSPSLKTTCLAMNILPEL